MNISVKNKLSINIIYLPLLILLTACGPSQKEKEEIAQLTCNILKNTQINDPISRLKEVNIAREKIGEELFLGTDNEIFVSLQAGFCEQLVLNDPIYKTYLDGYYVLKAKQEEEERIAREKRAEERRIAREKKEEEERLAEEQRIKAEKAEKEFAVNWIKEHLKIKLEKVEKEFRGYRRNSTKREVMEVFVEPLHIESDFDDFDSELNLYITAHGTDQTFNKVRLDSIRVDFKNSDIQPIELCGYEDRQEAEDRGCWKEVSLGSTLELSEKPESQQIIYFEDRHPSVKKLFEIYEDDNSITMKKLDDEFFINIPNEDYTLTIAIATLWYASKNDYVSISPPILLEL